MPAPSGKPLRPAPISTALRPGDERLCPYCKGKEWLTYDVPPGHPQWNQLVRCPTCGSGQQQAYLRRICGLSEEQANWTFEAGTRRNAGNAAAYDVARLLAQHPRYFYTLIGSYGVGKTRLLACIINAARAAGWTAVYTTTEGMLEYLRRAYGEHAGELAYDGRWELLTTAKVLCLDEFDRWNPTPWAQAKFFELVDARYRNCEAQLTCFAANARLEDLPGYVTSRIQDGRFYAYELTGQDVRRLLK